MTDKDKNAIVSLLDNIRKDIIEDQRAKNLRSSGHSAESLQIYLSPDGARLVGASYIQQQVEGRGPGEFPPLEDIYDWVRRKIKSFDISIDSLVFLIARKIAKQGTDIFLNKRPGISMKEIIERNYEAFKKSFAEAKKFQYRAFILEALRASANALKILIVACMLCSCISLKTLNETPPCDRCVDTLYAKVDTTILDKSDTTAVYFKPSTKVTPAERRSIVIAVIVTILILHVN